MKKLNSIQKKILKYLEEKFNENNYSLFDFDLKTISNKLNIKVQTCHKNLIQLSKYNFVQEIDYTFNFWIPSNEVDMKFWNKICKNRVNGYEENFKLHQKVCKIKSFENYFKEISLMRKNREKINYNLMVCFSSFVDEKWFKIDFFQIFYLQNLFIRLVKTSQIIENLTFDGSYIEAFNQLRNNFERSITIIYLLLNPNNFVDYLKYKKKDKSKNKYTIAFMSKKTKINYKIYQSLCNFVHVNLHDEDLQFVDQFGGFTYSQAYNIFNKDHFKFLVAYNNNILVDSYSLLFNIITKDINYETLDEPTKKIFDSSKKLKNITKF